MPTFLVFLAHSSTVFHLFRIIVLQRQDKINHKIPCQLFLYFLLILLLFFTHLGLLFSGEKWEINPKICTIQTFLVVLAHSSTMFHPFRITVICREGENYSQGTMPTFLVVLAHSSTMFCPLERSGKLIPRYVQCQQFQQFLLIFLLCFTHLGLLFSGEKWKINPKMQCQHFLQLLLILLLCFTLSGLLISGEKVKINPKIQRQHFLQFLLILLLCFTLSGLLSSGEKGKRIRCKLFIQEKRDQGTRNLEEMLFFLFSRKIKRQKNFQSF